MLNPWDFEAKRSQTVRYTPEELEEDPFLLGPGNFSGAENLWGAILGIYWIVKTPPLKNIAKTPPLFAKCSFSGSGSNFYIMQVQGVRIR